MAGVRHKHIVSNATIEGQFTPLGILQAFVVMCASEILGVYHALAVTIAQDLTVLIVIGFDEYLQFLLRSV